MKRRTHFEKLATKLEEESFKINDIVKTALPLIEDSLLISKNPKEVSLQIASLIEDQFTFDEPKSNQSKNADLKHNHAELEHQKELVFGNKLAKSESRKCLSEG